MARYFISRIRTKYGYVRYSVDRKPKNFILRQEFKTRAQAQVFINRQKKKDKKYGSQR